MKTHPTLTLAFAVILGIQCLGGTWAICADSQKPAGPAKPLAAPKPAPAPAPAPVPQSPAANGDALKTLRAAREKLTASGVRSIKARIIERVAIGERRFRLEGTYVQGTDLRLKLELKVLPDSTEEGLDGSFFEVCDGTILWARHQIGSQMRVTRRDVRQILNASKSAGNANMLTVELGLGGLPALLASLERSMNFDSLSQEKVNGKSFAVIGGSWNEASQQTFKANLGNRQTSHIPDSVRIYLEPGILFPRRIDFLKKHKQPEETEVIAELDFLDIVINAPLDDHQFEFEPPNGIRTIDVTNEYLRQLKGAPAK
jgi:hypothetical protein